MVNKNINNDLIADILQKCTEAKNLSSINMGQTIKTIHSYSLIFKAYSVFIHTMRYKSN